ncbi:MAG: hypothetical protein HY791_03595 [Deltaproteobacteria bacterium]|nr:hypothetical protein [Deltaproteobacteria bacterium]
MTTVLVLGLALPAVAQEQPQFRQKTRGSAITAEQLEKLGKTKKEEQSAQETPLTGDELTFRTDIIVLVGKVQSTVDGSVLLAIPRKPEELKEAVEAGDAVVIQDAKDIADRTILQGTMYRSYTVYAESGITDEQLEKLVGQEVRVQLRAPRESPALQIVNITR